MQPMKHLDSWSFSIFFFLLTGLRIVYEGRKDVDMSYYFTL